MQVNIHPSWENVLSAEFEKPYFDKLIHFVKTEYAQTRCYPKGNHIFAAFDRCPFDNVKVVIIGQDPYHGANQANGLCFSVNDGIAFPPSLLNIFKEIETDLGIPFPKSGNLERWADQGVLLLNATLTVRESMAGSHQNQGWETFTDAVIQKVSDEKKDVVFLLWGGFAKKKGAKIDRNRHFVLETGHPSPLSANRGLWFGNKHFSKANAFLQQKGKPPINW
ncbi:uracil-DNA glycosylase [Flavobacterium supellecticarium]|uniref:Uracil-DNA glycosylase n=1 Tax=Flavobacterium supellecticarium TaxID=2565924 RepID=A0A4S3ZQT2_9FLAO|nr:uracil-DNA glycosylase [Flavobacterium supellecticarium]THF47872.1 uracil-DNA glycosylase [Flavobacterium supellecticarium]